MFVQVTTIYCLKYCPEICRINPVFQCKTSTFTLTDLAIWNIFQIKVTPQDNLTTDTGVVDYEFQVINDTTNSIIDGIGNALGAQSFSGVIREDYRCKHRFYPKTESISLDATQQRLLMSGYHLLRR